MATPCIAAAPCDCMTECEKSNIEVIPLDPKPSELTAVPASLSAIDVAYVDAYAPTFSPLGGFTGDCIREPRPEGFRSAAKACVRPCPEFSGDGFIEDGARPLALSCPIPSVDPALDPAALPVPMVPALNRRLGTPR